MKAAWWRSLVIGGLSFGISIGLGLVSQKVASQLTLWLAIIFLLLLVAAGILFDVLGVATAAAHERPFHALASDRVAGAAQAIRLLRQADVVTTVTNDMIGDILGTLAGAMGAGLVFQLVRRGVVTNEELLATVVVAMTAGLSVGGKSFFKGFALGHAQEIVLVAGRVLAFSERLMGRPLLPAPAARRKESRR